MIIIAALSGLIIPVLLSTSESNEIQGTRALADTIAAQIDDDKATNAGLLISLKKLVACDISGISIETAY